MYTAIRLLSTVIVIILSMGILCWANLSPGHFTPQERKALTEFRAIVNSSELYRDFMQRDEFLLRWILDSDFDLKMARDKLYKTLKWRRENRIDTIIEREDFSDIERQCPYGFQGMDKTGRPVLTASVGACSIRKIVLSGNMERFRQLTFYANEAGAEVIRSLQNKGIPVTDILVIQDLQGFNIREHFCSRCIPLSIESVTLLIEHYPLYVAHTFVINAPRAAEVVWPVLLPLVPEKFKKSLHIYGFNKKEWQAEILKYIDASQLEHQYGGTKPTPVQPLAFTESVKRILKATPSNFTGFTPTY